MAVYDDQKVEDETVRRSPPADGFDEPVEKDLSPEQIQEREEEGGASESDDPDHAEADEQSDLERNVGSDGESDFFKPDQGQKQGLLRGALKKRSRKLLIAGGLGGGGLIVVLVLIFLFLSSLKLQQLTEHMIGYNFARTARTFRQSSSAVMSEKLTVDAADERMLGQLKAKYGEIRGSTWGKLDNFRPQKVLSNMRATGQLEYIIENEPRAILPGTKGVLKGIRINGNEIPIREGKWYDYFGRRADRLEFNGRLQANLESSLAGTKTLVRGSVAKKIRAELGIKLQRWERLSTKYRSAKVDEAERIAARETLERSKSTPRDGSLVNGVDDAARKAEQELLDCVDSPACYEKMKLTGELPDTVQKTVSSVFDNGLSKVTGTLSGTYAVALPICLVYDGSVERSGGTVAANSDRSVKNFHTLASAASQQRAGDATAQEIGGTSDLIGQIDSTPPELRASGITPTTDQYVSAQSAGSTDFTIFDALMPSAAADFVNLLAKPLCPTITNPFVGLGLGLLELTPGAAQAVRAAETPARVAITSYLRDFAAQLFSKRTAVKIGRDAAVVGTTTVLAKYIVLSRMGSADQAAPLDENLVISADQGASINAGDINREQFYGRPLSRDELVQSNEQNQEDIAFANSQKSLYDRYLNVDDADSFVAKTGFALSSKLGSSLTKIIQNLLTSVGSILHPTNNSLLSALPESRALAAANDDYYKIVQWDWTVAEQKLIDSNPDSYSPLNNAFFWENSVSQSQKDEVIKKDKCFTSDMGTLLSNKDIVRDSSGYVLADQGDCAPNKLSFNNPDGLGDLVFRYRLYMRNNNTLDHLTGIQEPSKSEGFLSPGSPSLNDGNTYVLGDSLSEGMEKEGNLTKKLQDTGLAETVTVAAKCGRHLFQDGVACGPGATDLNYPSGQKQIEQAADQEAIKNSGRVIIGLGTNDASSNPDVFYGNAAALIDRIRVFNPNVTIYWVSLYSKAAGSNNYPALNAKLNQLAQAKNISIIDWASVAAPYYTPGDIHPSGHYDDMADFVVTEIQRLRQ